MLRSELNVLKNCGKEYGADRPMKRVINNYLEQCIKSLFPAQDILDPERWWGLILDTEELLTTDALLASGRFQRDRIIIPNPCKEEAATIADRCPGVIIRQCTTHELLNNNCSALRDIMSTDCAAALRFIFLDYNGRHVPYRGPSSAFDRDPAAILSSQCRQLE